MDISALAPWASAIVALVALVVSLAGNRSKAHAAKIRTIEERLDVKAGKQDVAEIVTGLSSRTEAQAMRIDRLEDRTIKIEECLEHLPDKDVTHRLEMSLTELRGEMRVLAERIKPISAISERLQDAILERADT
jgi:hypothetical protein